MTQFQNYAGPPMVNCVNGHPCNQHVTTCRVCGADVPWPAAPAAAARTPGYSYSPLPAGTAAAAAPLSSGDAAELAARRAASAALLAKYTGWKPLVFWYVAWTVLLVIGAFSAFSAKGGVGPGFVALGLAALSALYARYLYRGGMRRVWFFIF